MTEIKRTNTKRKRRIILSAGAVLAALAVLAYFAWRPDGEDILIGRGGPASTPTAPTIRIPGAGGGPLFRFGAAYLDGRSVWLAARFRRDRDSLRSAPIPAEAEVNCTVHRSPFTEGPWVESLDPDGARQRRETEGQAVESVLTFFVPRADPRRVLLFLMASDFHEKLPGEGTMKVERFIPPIAGPLEGLDAPPPLAANEWLTRERCSRPLAFPTAVWYVSAAFREEDCLVQVSEAWRNCGGAGHAAVRLSSCHCAILPRGGGSLVRMTSFYSGQAIPPLTDGFVSRLTASYVRKVAKAVVDRAGAWEPPPETARRLDGIGL